MHLVDLAEFAPQVILDIRYATDRNVAGRELYPAPRALLARGTAHKLVAAAEALRAQGYGLVVWDAYRPLSVQRILWEIKPDPRFVADPAVGSRHNRAAAVDVTLVRLDGQPLAMPSDFDAFGPEADPAWEGHPREVREIALTLRQVMTDNGFLINPAEWWHFSDEEWRRYPILDLPLTVRVPAP
jgi:D-alanyl-D-alanine dipeptidase